MSSCHSGKIRLLRGPLGRVPANLLQTFFPWFGTFRWWAIEAANHILLLCAASAYHSVLKYGFQDIFDYKVSYSRSKKSSIKTSINFISHWNHIEIPLESLQNHIRITSESFESHQNKVQITLESISKHIGKFFESHLDQFESHQNHFRITSESFSNHIGMKF